MRVHAARNMHSHSAERISGRRRPDWGCVVSLKGRYAWAQKVAEGKFHGTIEESDGKFRMKGTVATEAEKNEIWAAIKTIPTWQEEVGGRYSRHRRSCAGAARRRPSRRPRHRRARPTR